MTRHSFYLTMVFLFFAPFFFTLSRAQPPAPAPTHPVVVLQKIQGAVTVTRYGKELTLDAGLKDGFILKDKDQIRLGDGGRAIIAAKSFSLQLAPQSLFMFDLAPQGERPGIVSLVYGHLRAVVRPKKPAVKLDVLRVRLPGFFVGVKSAGPSGADFLVHSARNKAEFLKQLEAVATAVPRVHTLSDMNIFEDVYIRVDVFEGEVAVRAEEATSSVAVVKGSYFESSKKSATTGDAPVDVTGEAKVDSPENLTKVRKFFGL